MFEIKYKKNIKNIQTNDFFNYFESIIYMRDIVLWHVGFHI